MKFFKIFLLITLGLTSIVAKGQDATLSTETITNGYFSPKAYPRGAWISDNLGYVTMTENDYKLISYDPETRLQM